MTTNQQQQQHHHSPRWTSASSEDQLRKIFDTTKKPVIMFLLVHSTTIDDATAEKETNQNQSAVTKLKQLASRAFEKYFFTQEKLMAKLSPLMMTQQQQQKQQQHNVFQLVEWKINLMEKGSFSKTLAAAMNVPLLGVTLGAVFNGELLDIVKVDDGLKKDNNNNNNNSVEIDEDLLTKFAQKFAQFCSHKLDATATTTTASGAEVAEKTASGGASVDIAKILQMGKDLLGKRNPMYAEKFFGKAIATLEAIINDPAMQMKIHHQAKKSNSSGGDDDDDDNIADICASLADSYGWRGLSRFILGDISGLADDVTKLSNVLKFSKSAEQSARAPLGIVLRAETLAALSDALKTLNSDAKWNETECSEKILRQKIEEGNRKNEKSELQRALLIFTLFLSGDMERCLTEAIKLKTYGFGFGNTAVNAICRFLGPEHELVKRV